MTNVADEVIFSYTKNEQKTAEQVTGLTTMLMIYFFFSDTNCGFKYCTCVIISHGLYIFYTIFTAAYIVDRLVLQTTYVLNKEILQSLSLKSPVCNQEQVVMARGWYIDLEKPKKALRNVLL